MWVYEKKLLYPVNIRKPDLRVAKLLAAQYGGPASELAAAITYLTQRYSMPDDRIRATLTDIGTGEPKWLLFPEPGENTLSIGRRFSLSLAASSSQTVILSSILR